MRGGWPRIGVRYALQGNVQRSDKQIRVNARQVDAETGAYLRPAVRYRHRPPLRVAGRCHTSLANSGTTTLRGADRLAAQAPGTSAQTGGAAAIERDRRSNSQMASAQRD